MEFKKFESILDGLKNVSKKTNSLYSLGVNIIEYTDNYESIITNLLTEYYTEEGYDWISWYLYEKFPPGSDQELKAYDEDKNEICKDYQGLWELVEDIRKKNPA